LHLLFSFEGRIRRLHYWLARIVITIVAVTLLVIEKSGHPEAMTVIVCGLLSLVVLWVDLAFMARRWHDRDKSAWWVLITFVPIIGGLWTFVECGCLDGTPGSNRFGPSPKGFGG
jgi:uncharacterized membrane protein YhaH (DUF805 family)